MKHKISIRIKYIFLIIITLIGITIVFIFNTIPQDQNYHKFADSTALFSIENFWNVISNLPILFAGIMGMIYSLNEPKQNFKEGYFLFFTGISLTSIGSCYYHLMPNNYTLLWDRLPMTIAFMSFLAITFSEFINLKFARNFLYPLLIIGITSVVYWYVSESIGSGDLRFYILVQFLPLILIPFIILFFKSQSNIARYIWMILLTYLVSKLFEITDYQVYQFVKIISGHSLKHITVSFAPIILIYAMKRERRS